jgi:integrase
VADWTISGRSPKTAQGYVVVLKPLLFALGRDEDVDLTTVKSWVAQHPSPQSRRYRGRAARAWFKWAHEEEIVDAPWWKRIPLASVEERPQPTATEDDYKRALAAADTRRDRAIIATLWSTGIRRSELARMRTEDLLLDDGQVLIPVSKNKRPRVASLSPEAVKLLRRYLSSRVDVPGPVWFGVRGPLGVDGMRGVLRRVKAPTPHAWRRGWAVASLRAGISQASIESAGGWRHGGPMVGRYTKALASEIAMHEFETKRWTA